MMNGDIEMINGLLTAGNLYLYQVCATTAESGKACSSAEGINGPSGVTPTAAAGEVALSWTDNSTSDMRNRLDEKLSLLNSYRPLPETAVRKLRENMTAVCHERKYLIDNITAALIRLTKNCH